RVPRQYRRGTASTTCMTSICTNTTKGTIKMPHQNVTTNGRIATGADVDPLLVSESRRGLRRHPQLPSAPGSRFVCVEDLDGWPMTPMEMSIWEHETAVSYEKHTNHRTIFDPPYDPHRDEADDYVVTYTKYHAARCIESF